MLAREHFLKALNKSSGPSIKQVLETIERYQALWWLFCDHYDFYQTSSTQPLALYWGESSPVYQVQQAPHPYCIKAIDGSQVYPDRHEGLSIGLIQTAAVVFDYGTTDSEFSVDYDLAIIREADIPEHLTLSTDTINLLRTAYEYKHLVQNATDQCDLMLLDGILLQPATLWCAPHLMSWWQGLCEPLLQDLARVSTPYASCISRSRARGCVQFLDTIAEGHGVGALVPTITSRITDYDIYMRVLAPGQRTAWCVRQDYRAHELCPAWFYLRTAYDLVRVELPLKHAQNGVDGIAGYILDQCHKGGDFPIALAQAHQYAVITRQDQVFVAHMMRTAEGDAFEGLSAKRQLKR